MTKPWNNDTELFELFKNELFTGVVCDVMDQLGYLHQFLPPYLRPLSNEMILIGRAMPVMEADIFSQSDETGNGPLAKMPFGMMFHALDDLRPGEIYVASGSNRDYAMWGELMSTRAMQLGANGALIDGYSRDTKGVLSLKFPTFSKGSYAQDQGPRGKVIDWRVPIEIGGIRIEPRSLVFGDIDGVIVIPKEIEEATVLQALNKVRGEKRVAQAIQNGMSTVEAYNTYGIM